MKHRHAVIAATLSGLLALPALAQQERAPDCKDLNKAQAVNASFDADDDARKAALQEHTAERLHYIDAQAKALIADGVWTEADRRAWFGKQRASAVYTKLEQQKKEPLFSVQMGRSTAAGIRATNPTGACSYALSTLSAYDELRKITDTQYDLLEQGLAALAASHSATPPK